MSHKIYFSICGEGYGHSSRKIAISERIKGMGADLLISNFIYIAVLFNVYRIIWHV